MKQSFSTITPNDFTIIELRLNESKYIQWRVGVGTKSLILLIAPIPEATFLDNLSMCVCHRRFSSINIPSDFTEVTFSNGTLSIESSGWLDKILNFSLDPISINSVLEVFKVGLLEISDFFIDYLNRDSNLTVLNSHQHLHK